jgi:hypothetical protein
MRRERLVGRVAVYFYSVSRDEVKSQKAKDRSRVL